MTRVVVIDHRDSFAFLLGEQLARAGAEVETLRSDETSVEGLQRHLARRAPALVVLSPGPGHPRDAGVTVPWLRTEPELPVLGVCLGHQALAVAAGGVVGRAPRVVHGRASVVTSRPTALFPTGLPGGAGGRVAVGRYHSLAVTRVPRCFEVLAVTEARTPDDGLVMAISHRTRFRVGLQFHPESVLSPFGGALVAALLERAVAHVQSRFPQPALATKATP